MQQHDADSSLNASLHEDTGLLNAIHEDIHWLLLIAGHVLTEEAMGESPMIPSAIMEYSISQHQAVDIDTTLKMLASPSQGVDSLPGGGHTADMVVRLVSAVFRLCEVEKRALEAHLGIHMSPQVTRSSMWFLRRWLRAYLLPNETYYAQMSLALTAAFGRDTDGGQWTVAFLVDKVMSNLPAWSAEPEVVDDSLDVLVALTERRERCMYVMKCNNFLTLASDFANNHRTLTALSISAKRHLCRALVLACSSSIQSDTTHRDYWQMVMKCLETRLQAVLNQPDMEHEVQVKSEVLSLIQCMCGVAEATTTDNVKALYDFLLPVLITSVKLLDLYHNYEEVVESIVEFFSVVANRMICYLAPNDSRLLYETSLNMIQMYAKHNSGRTRMSKDSEEDQCSDILTLIDLLTNILSKDYIDFGIPDEDGAGEGTTVCPADVVLYGLNILVPLLTPELLKFPVLCTNYTRLITYLAEMYPERVCQLPEDLLQSLLASIEFSLSNAASDITKMCLEFVGYISSHVTKARATGTLPHEAMAHFLKLVFGMLLLETFDMDLLETASTTLFSLICCHQAVYQELVSDLLRSQTDPLLQERLAQAFHKLTPPTLHLTETRPNRIIFRENFDHFLIDVRGFLCVK